MASAPRIRTTAFRLLAAAGVLAISACGGGSPSDAAAAETSSADGPCGLLKLAEVRQALPQVRAAERDRSVDEHSITTCFWRTDTGGRALIVQRWEGEDSALSGIQDQMTGMVDPLKPQAADAVRYETFSGIGDDARAVVERRDEGRGILSDIACLVLKRGEHALSLCSVPLAALERPRALKALQELGRAAASRLE